MSCLSTYPENNDIKIPSSSSVMGDIRSVSFSPKAELSCPYGIIDENLIETFDATGGSTDTNNNLFRCQTGTSVGGYGVIRSKHTAQYKPGFGVLGRITAKFTDGVADSYQIAGMFSLTETLAFGYDGTTFGIIHEYDGKAEKRSIQITGAAGGSETATVILDGDSVSCSLTASTVQTNAFEVARDLAADATVGEKWRIEQVDDSVICISKTVGAKSGTYSFSSSTATATITQNQAGANKTKDTVAQADWNIDACIWLDTSKINVYQVQFAYLGAAGPILSVYNPETAEFVQAHIIEWANSNTTPIFGNPTMKIGWASASLGSSGTNLTVEGASAMVSIEGPNKILGDTRSLFNSKASITTTETNILTIKNRVAYGNQYNLGDISPTVISVNNDHNKSIVVRITKNATIGGTTNYQYVDESSSIALYDTSGTTITGGDVIFTFTVTPGQSLIAPLSQINVTLLTEETLTISAEAISGTTTTTDVSLTWIEEV